MLSQEQRICEHSKENEPAMSDFFHEYLPGDPRERIKDLLLERKITQAQLAETIGISESTLNRYLSGQTEKIPVDLLGLTDIPFVTNFDIEKLGLSVGAAKKLLQRKVDPALVSQLIEMPAFNLLIVQLGAAKRGTFDAGYDYMMEVFGTANELLAEHLRTNQGDRQAAKNAIDDIRALSMSPKQMELRGIEEAMRQIVEGFRQGSEKYLEETRALTSEIMRNITGTLRTQMNNPMKLRGITPEMMVDAIMGNLKKTELTEEQLAKLRAAILPLFTRPQEPAAKTGDQSRRGLSSGTKP